MKLKPLLICLIGIFLLMFITSGCGPQKMMGNKFDVNKVSQIRKGKTTKEEILTMFGIPYQKSINSNQEMWTYMYQGTTRGWSYIRSLKGLFGKIDSPTEYEEGQSLLVIFKGNIVQDYSMRTFGQ